MKITSQINRYFRTLSSAIAFMISIIPMTCQQYQPSGMIENKEYDEKLHHMLDSDVPAISVDALMVMAQKHTILDAREAEEYNVGHIADAINVGFNEFTVESIKDIDKDEPIIVYCSVGYRSEKITKKLLDAGYTNVRNLYGSIFEWVNRGYPIVDSTDASTQDIHTYNEKWGKWMLNPSYNKIN